MPTHKVYLALLAYGGWVRKEIAAFQAECMLLGHALPHIEDVIVRPFETFPVDVARNQAVDAANKAKADVLIMCDADCGPPKGWFEPTVNFLLDHHGPAFVICPYNGGDGNPMIFKHSTNSTRHPVRDMDIRRMTREEVAHRRGFQPLGDGGTHLVAYRMDCFSMPPPWYNMTRSPDGMKLLAGEDSSCHQLLQNHGAKCYGSFDFLAQHWKEDAHDNMLVLERKDIDEFYLKQAKAILEMEAEARGFGGYGEAARAAAKAFPHAQVRQVGEAGNGEVVVQELGECPGGWSEERAKELGGDDAQQ